MFKDDEQTAKWRAAFEEELSADLDFATYETSEGMRYWDRKTEGAWEGWYACLSCLTGYLRGTSKDIALKAATDVLPSEYHEWFRNAIDSAVEPRINEAVDATIANEMRDYKTKQ